MYPTPEEKVKKMLGASALEIYEANKKMQHILTGIDELDEILGGGFQRRQITEICEYFSSVTSRNCYLYSYKME